MDSNLDSNATPQEQILAICKWHYSLVASWKLEQTGKDGRVIYKGRVDKRAGLEHLCFTYSIEKPGKQEAKIWANIDGRILSGKIQKSGHAETLHINLADDILLWEGPEATDKYKQIVDSSAATNCSTLLYLLSKVN